MPLVVGVTFRRSGKVYYFEPGSRVLREGNFVIAETANGLELGEVVVEPKDVAYAEIVAPLKRVVRIASGDDLDREASNRKKEDQAMQVCEENMVARNLPMKLLDAECSFDGSIITFSFSAENRVDFRELVKEVASVLKVRVQMRQIGVRDEARMIGGYGACGRSFCCSTFLTSFKPVSMKMAKDQSLFLNPAKFSGCCGKLMCCLRYEHQFYKSSQEWMPSVGAILDTDQGRVRVTGVNVISNTLAVETEEGVQLHIPAGRVKLEGLCRKHGTACNMADKNCKALIASGSGMSEDESLQEEDEDNGNDVASDEPRPVVQPRSQTGSRQQDNFGVRFREPAAGSPQNRQARNANQSAAKSSTPQVKAVDEAPESKGTAANTPVQPKALDQQQPGRQGGRRRGRRPGGRPPTKQNPSDGQ